MWLLELHIVSSILYLITFIAFFFTFKEKIKENGWLEESNKTRPYYYLLFFVPVFRLLIVIALFVMIGSKKTDWDELHKKEDPENEKSR